MRRIFIGFIMLVLSLLLLFDTIFYPALATVLYVVSLQIVGMIGLALILWGRIPRRIKPVSNEKAQ